VSGKTRFTIAICPSRDEPGVSATARSEHDELAGGEQSLATFVVD
jgi:hypothetical protein